MKLISTLLLLSLCAGCTVVSTDFMPKLKWRWSYEAKEQRARNQSEKDWIRTNHVANPGR